MDLHVVDSMTCPICFELAIDAVETSCCHHVFCQPCLSLVGSNSCPQCRQPFQMQISHVSRRIIGAMPVPCSIRGCNKRVMRSELADHELQCPHRLFLCPAQKCLFEGLRKQFAFHIATEHEHNLIKCCERIFDQDPGASSTVQFEDRIETKRNEKGAVCRLGSTGKFYCGQKIDGGRCRCCDGNCGPTNGCNCSSCMKLDVKVRGLPKGWYVNRDGFSCRKGPETGNVYCGRMVVQHNRYCDGYCGPTNGPNCDSCSILQKQLGGRYHRVWDK